MEVRKEYIKNSTKKSISKRPTKSKNQFEKSLIYVRVENAAHFMRNSSKINMAEQNSSYTSETSIIA